MKRLFFITTHNMKKKKEDVAILLFLITLASLLLYTSISVFVGMDSILDNAYDKAHSADLLFMSNIEEEKIADIMTSQEEVTEYEASECFWLTDVEYKKVGETENRQAQFFFGKIEEERRIGKLTENARPSYPAIVLPYYLKAAEGYAEGDKCHFVIGGKDYSFEVVGFVEDPLFATPLNVSVYGVYISNACYEDLMEDNTSVKAAKYMQHKVRLAEGMDSFAFDKKLSSILSKEIPQLSQTLKLGMNWETMKDGVSIMSKISMGIVLVFSVLLILIALIIIRFSIHNFIERNLKNVGVLQAAGYTSSELRLTVLMEMGMITFLALLLGIFLGIAGSGMIGRYQGIMLGIRWGQLFHFKAACLTIGLILCMVLGTTFLCSRLYKMITVLESLRQGIHTHNFKKNHFAFAQSRLSVPITLAGKNILLEKGKSISILGIVMLLSFSACIGFGLYENFAVRSDNLLKMVGSESGDIAITGENLQEAGEKLAQWENIEKVLYYGSVSVHLESKEEETEVSCDIWKQPELVQNEMMIRGRLPRYENEIVLTSSIAKILKVEVGDTIYVTGQQERKDYLVCGIDQKINNMGLKTMLHEKGANRLNGNSQTIMLYLYINEDTTYEEISKAILAEYPTLSIMDSNKVVAGTMNGVTMAMIAICIAFVVITIFVVVMVEVLLIKSKVIREKKNIGINKAFGFTTRELILQTMMMNLPLIVSGAAFGAGFSVLFVKPLIIAALSFSGIEKCSFTISVPWIVLTVVGIILVAVMASFLAAIKIRKIEPVKMLVEE